MKRFLLLVLLLALLPSLASAQFIQGTSEATFNRATVAFGSVAASYTALLTNTAPVKQYRGCAFNNSTDAAVSWDNGTTAILDAQPASTVIVLDLGAASLDVRTSIRLKYTSSAPTTGNVYINCWY